MGSEVSHERYCCGKPEMLEKSAAAQENTETDLPIGQTAPGTVSWSSVNHPTATGMGNKDVERETEVASTFPSAAQIMQRTTELQGLGDTHPSADQSEEDENKATTMISPDRQTSSPTQERPATAQRDEGMTKTDLPLQAPMEMGVGDAEDMVTDLTTVESNTVGRKRLRGKLCKPSPFCRWLKQLRSPAEKAKVKPGAMSSQE